MSLEQDYTTVPGQLFACLSIVGPEAPQKNDKFGIKIRGCFNSRDEAAAHAKRLQNEDSTFDIYVVDMYKWLLIPPDPTKIEDVHFNNEKLEALMQGYRENQAQAAKMFEERKRDMQAIKLEVRILRTSNPEMKTVNTITNQMNHPSVIQQKFLKSCKRKNRTPRWKNSLRRQMPWSHKKSRSDKKSAKRKLRKRKVKSKRVKLRNPLPMRLFLKRSMTEKRK